MKKQRTTLVRDICSQVLRMFGKVENHRLDLKDLYRRFQTARDAPPERDSLLFAIEVLRREGLIEFRGGEFYSMTEKGVKAIASLGQ
jgi:hypothetical protein